MNATIIFERVKSLFEGNEWRNSNWEVEFQEIKKTINTLDLKETGKLVDRLFEFGVSIQEEIPIINPINSSLGRSIPKFQEKFWEWVREVEDSEEDKKLNELMAFVRDLTDHQLLVLTVPEPKTETALEDLVAGTLFLEKAKRD